MWSKMTFGHLTCVGLELERDHPLWFGWIWSRILRTSWLFLKLIPAFHRHVHEVSYDLGFQFCLHSGIVLILAKNLIDQGGQLLSRPMDEARHCIASFCNSDREKRWEVAVPNPLASPAMFGPPKVAWEAWEIEFEMLWVPELHSFRWKLSRLRILMVEQMLKAAFMESVALKQPEAKSQRSQLCNEAGMIITYDKDSERAIVLLSRQLQAASSYHLFTFVHFSLAGCAVLFPCVSAPKKALSISEARSSKNRDPLKTSPKR